MLLYLQSVLAQHSQKFTGVLNGIDQHTWNPLDDPLLPPYGHYTPGDTRGKEVSKQALLAELGLPYTTPTEAKGEIDLLFMPYCDPQTGLCRV